MTQLKKISGGNRAGITAGMTIMILLLILCFRVSHGWEDSFNAADGTYTAWGQDIMQLTEIKDGIPAGAKTLVIHSTSIVRIDEQDAINLADKGLTKLVIKDNPLLQDFTSRFVEQMNIELEEMIITNNTELDRMVRLRDRCYKRFKSLTFSNNGPVHPDKHLNDLIECESIEKLIMQYMNELNFFPDLAVLSVLRYLDLGYNQIASINAEDFAHNPLIETLILDGNPIVSISGNCGLLTRLQHISCYDCTQLASPGKFLTSCPGLRELHLSGWNSTKFPNFENARATLESLIMRGMPIKEIPEMVLSDFPYLGELDLSNNTIGHIPDLGFSANPISLNLAYNSIETISKVAFDGLSALQDISLVGNRLSTVDFISAPIIALADNPLVCDARIAWIVSPASTVTDKDSIYCGAPWNKKLVDMSFVSPQTSGVDFIHVGGGVYVEQGFEQAYNLLNLPLEGTRLAGTTRSKSECAMRCRGMETCYSFERQKENGDCYMKN